MQAVETQFVAAPFRVLATDNGPHPAKKWATLTTKLIVTPNTFASPGSRDRIAELQGQINEVLLDCFEYVGPQTSNLGILAMSKQATTRICDLARCTQWAEEFRPLPIREAIEEIIHRNLMSSLGISLRME